MKTRLAIALAALCASGLGAHADSDLDNIPTASTQQPADALPARYNIYVQSDLTLSAPRGALVVPLASPPSWDARLFADARLQWQLGSDLTFSYSGRLNLRAEEGLAFPSHETIRHDLREAYLSWQAGGVVFVQLGRINLKSGVALGFNPTDFFKTRAVVEPLSADPTVLREDRLGTVMLLGQAVWAGASLMLALAPKLARDTPPYANDALRNFDPMFDRTNARGRALVKMSVDLFDDVSPELLAYAEDGRIRFGLNLTKGFGQAVVAYLEWAGGTRPSLADDAFEDGVRAGVLPSVPPLPVGARRGFSHDLAVGASYATALGITFNLEYDYHQAGFSGTDWRNWFAGGSSGDPDLPGELWFLRGYAGDQQEPVARQSLFLRADWPHAVYTNLALTGFVDTDLRDGSGLAQVTADYYLSPQWTVGGLADIYYGGRRSDFGSLPQSVNVLAKVTRYF